MIRDHYSEEDKISENSADSKIESGNVASPQVPKLIGEIQGVDEIGNIETSDPHFRGAEMALEKHAISGNHQLYARRYASEAAARYAVGEDGVILDDLSLTENNPGENIPVKGGNFPIYDISSNHEIASVKTHWDANGLLSETALQAYKRDFLKQRGYGRSTSALERDGENIVAARNLAKVLVPPELETATAAEVAAYLCDHSVMRIPADHVGPVRERFIQEAKKFPENFGLSENPSAAELNAVALRIQSLGLRSDELLDIIEKRTGRRY